MLLRLEPGRYTIGFILNKNGTLLDGTLLEEAIHVIDAVASQKLLGYFATCTHASIIKKLIQSRGKYKRLIGIQPNGSVLTLKTLIAMDKPIVDSPETFAKDIAFLKAWLDLTIIGGCCGTTQAHLQSIAELLAKLS